MARKDVEQTLALTELNKLTKLKVQKRIKISDSSSDSLFLVFKTRDITEEIPYNLFLTTNGLMEEVKGHIKAREVIPSIDVVDFYNLDHNKLRKIIENLEEVCEQARC